MRTTQAGKLCQQDPSLGPLFVQRTCWCGITCGQTEFDPVSTRLRRRLGWTCRLHHVDHEPPRHLAHGPGSRWRSPATSSSKRASSSVRRASLPSVRTCCSHLWRDTAAKTSSWEKPDFHVVSAAHTHMTHYLSLSSHPVRGTLAGRVARGDATDGRGTRVKWPRCCPPARWRRCFGRLLG